MPLVPTEVTFRGLVPCPLLDAEVRKLVRWLEHGVGEIVSCRVVLGLAQERRHKERPAEVRVEVLFPAFEPVVVERLASGETAWSRHDSHVIPIPDLDEVHRQIRCALADAFAAIRRRLQDAIAERRDARRSA